MAAAHIRIPAPGSGDRPELVIAGHHFEDLVSQFTLVVTPGDRPPSVSLEMNGAALFGAGHLTASYRAGGPGTGITVELGDADVAVDPLAAAALRALGWTPPAGHP